MANVAKLTFGVVLNIVATSHWHQDLNQLHINNVDSTNQHPPRIIINSWVVVEAGRTEDLRAIWEVVDMWAIRYTGVVVEFLSKKDHFDLMTILGSHAVLTTMTRWVEKIGAVGGIGEDLEKEKGNSVFPKYCHLFAINLCHLSYKEEIKVPCLYLSLLVE